MVFLSVRVQFLLFPLVIVYCVQSSLLASGRLFTQLTGDKNFDSAFLQQT